MFNSILTFDDDLNAFETLIQDALHSARTLLCMEVAFVSELVNGWRVFRHIDRAPHAALIRVGDQDPLEESYCQRVADGRLPELMRDARKNPEASKLAVTASLPVGAHLSVPIRFSDGKLFGTFCCFSTHPDETLNHRDLSVMHFFAEFVGNLLERLFTATARHRDARACLRSILDKQQLTVVYQPIIDIRSNTILGHEALTRFPAMAERTPEQWFNEATEVGLLEELELAAVKKALQGLADLPSSGYLSMNSSPETLLNGALASLLASYPLDRLVLEVTEHASISDYAAIAAMLNPLREKGLRLSVDDAGAGYASFRHILELKPDVIKLDRSLIRHIDKDVTTRALAAALVRFVEETGGAIVAEGVETEAELHTLRALKIHYVQGNLLGSPEPLITFPAANTSQHLS